MTKPLPLTTKRWRSNRTWQNAWLGRGNVYTELKRYDEAFAAYDAALALKADLESAWLGRGNVYTELKRYDEAFAAYDEALALKPNSGGRLAWSRQYRRCTQAL